MPPKPASDLIREHGEQLAALNQRVDHLQVHLDKLETALLDDRRSHQQLDKLVAMLVRDLEGFEKKLDESRSRRWEIWKLIVAALVGAILSSGVGIVAKKIEQNLQGEPIPEKH